MQAPTLQTHHKLTPKGARSSLGLSMGHNLTILLLGTLGASFVSGTQAATDGQVGQTSQGSLRISLNVAPQVQISNLQDISLATNGLQVATSHSQVCIYSRTGQYQLLAQGSGQDASFRLNQTGQTSESDQWSYQVQYDDGSGPRPLASGVPLGGLAGADPHSQTCGTTGLNGQLLLSSQPSSDQRPRPGLYTGTLTLLVAPE